MDRHAQMVTALVMLNLAGGESVDDLRVLEKDEGLGWLLLMAELHQMRRAERRAQHNRWRRKRRRTVPSPTTVFRYLDRFHDEAEEAGRRPHRAVIPTANDALMGASQSQRGPGGVRGEPFWTHRGDIGPRIEYGAGYGRHADRDTQAAGVLLLQKNTRHTSR